MLKLNKTLLLALATLAIASSAYAKVDSCPPPAAIQFNKASYEWQSAKYPWRSQSKPRDVANLGKVTLNAVKLTITPTGDVAECFYQTENKEDVVFTKGVVPAKAQSKGKVTKAVASEIIPIPAHDRKVWPNVNAQNVFECKPSAQQACKFDDLTAQGIGEDFGLRAYNSDLTNALDMLEEELRMFNQSPLEYQCSSQFRRLRDGVLRVVEIESIIREAEARLQDELRYLKDKDPEAKDPVVQARVAELNDWQTWLIDVPLSISKVGKENVQKTIDSTLPKCELPTTP